MFVFVPCVFLHLAAGMVQQASGADDLTFGGIDERGAELGTVYNLPDMDPSIPTGGGEQAVVGGKSQGANPTR
jgi:hypothetical protein